jgi:hypothetical protein
MRMFTISMRSLAFLIIAACGSVGARPPDAGSGSDAGSDAPPGGTGAVERLDWRTMRGAPIATRSVTLPAAGLFSLSGDGFVTSACQSQNAPGCAFTWRDLSGIAGTQRDHLGRVTSIAISPDGKLAQLVALDAIESCNDGQGISQVSRGTLQLLDLVTAAVRFALPLRSDSFGVQGFTPLADWFFTSPLAGTACSSSGTTYRSTTAPFGPPAGLDSTEQFIQAVDGHRWVVARRINNRDDLGIADPLTQGSYQSLAGGDPDAFFDVTQGWVHVYQGFADLVRTVVSVPPAGPQLQTAVVADEDWHPFGARGRWIRVCGLPQPTGAETFRDCRVIDAQGEIGPVNFRITFAATRADDAVLLDSGAIVFVGPSDDGSPAVQRLVFATGRRDVLHPGDGALQPLGDGAAALVRQGKSAWLVDAQHDELVAEHLTQVAVVPPLLARALGRSPGRQDDVAILVSSPSAGQFSLAILDVRTRRLATVTDGLFFTVPAGAPLSFSDTCGQPWTTRVGGTVIEGLFQGPRQLFFVEEGMPETLWLLPIDLSGPPRRLAQLTGNPIMCHTPLASPDGRRVGFAEDSADGTTTQITLSTDP